MSSQDFVVILLVMLHWVGEIFCAMVILTVDLPFLEVQVEKLFHSNSGFVIHGGF